MAEELTQTSRQFILFDDGLGDHVFKIAVNFSVGRLHHQDTDETFLGVDEEVRAVSPGPPIGGVGKHGATIGVVGYNSHAETEALAARASRKGVEYVSSRHHFNSLAA